ncbi:class I SAM-dependent methyltransferase [Methanobacterium paludis]|uniref:Methyltransferase type 11 n=1 Tax=Methanobacterium paludis (strain DSM 25820 / JCM 18151 / SWAN1) TaxID=868131 RepID=F6D549_METPW|nr:methyltransferase domain-containing protein [Methanobacterium paludis]AEG17584.1 Methyltransferase type 11 [Methanobacterium paludis]
MFENRKLKKIKKLNKKAAKPEFKSDEILKSLKLHENDRIADIGCGGGYFTFKFSKNVGKNGIVYAVDMELECLDYVKDEAQKQGIKNIETVLAEDGSLELENGLSLVFLRNVFHHIEDPVNYFKHLKQFLAPDGRIVIIDYKKTKKINFVNLFGHYTPEDEILSVMENSGYLLSEKFNFLSSQSFILFKNE